MEETGVIHGRFQVLHNDHLKYLLAGKDQCAHLVVGITNPDPVLTRKEQTDPHRSAAHANPLTYYERYVMLRAALAEAGVAQDEFSLVPFPINVPELYSHYVPTSATYFVTIYDDWGRQKLRRFQELGLKTAVLWERPVEQKGISSAEIRGRMIREELWGDLVPPSTRRLMEQWRIPERLRKQHATHLRKDAAHLREDAACHREDNA